MFPMEAVILRTILLLLAAFAMSMAGHALADNATFDPPLDARLNEQVVMVPAGESLRDRLETTIFKPDGPGPFPLLLMNHGKQPGPSKQQKRERFVYLATEFVRRGYAVMVPMRTGYGQSTGDYRDRGCDMTASAFGQARDLRDVLDYARSESWIDAQRMVVAGQSYGGMAVLALATASEPGVRAVLNFSGGLRYDNSPCDWQATLTKAFGLLGKYNHIPTLWLYGANDSYFAPPLVVQLHQAFVGAGGHARLVDYGAFKRDAHLTVGSRDGVAYWLPPTLSFLRSMAMPVKPIVEIGQPPALPATGFAAQTDVDAVPYLTERGRAVYRAFLSRPMPRAFALSASGAWGWAEEGESPDLRALASCQQLSNAPCQLYAVDDNVVWNGAGAAAGGAD